MAELNIDELATVMGNGDGTWQSSMSKVEGLFAAGLIGEEQLRDAVSKVFNTTNWSEINDLTKTSKNRAIKMSGGTWQGGYQKESTDPLRPDAGERVPDQWVIGRDVPMEFDAFGNPLWDNSVWDTVGYDPVTGDPFTHDVVIPEDPIIDPITGEPKPSYEQLAGLGGTSWSYPRIHGTIVDRPSGVGTSDQYGYAMPNPKLGFGGGLLHIPEGSSFGQVYAQHLAGLESNYEANLDALAAAENAPPDHTFSGAYDDAGNPIYNEIIEPINTPVPYTGPVNVWGDPLLDPRQKGWTQGGVASDPAWMWDEWNTAYGTDYSNWQDWFDRTRGGMPSQDFLLTDPEGNVFEGNPFNDPNMQIWGDSWTPTNIVGGTGIDTGMPAISPSTFNNPFIDGAPFSFSAATAALQGRDPNNPMGAVFPPVSNAIIPSDIFNLNTFTPGYG